IIEKAYRQSQGVMLFGDYDVDGITSLALLKGTLNRMGVKASHYIPHRIKEGYGLSKDIVTVAKQRNVKLLITVDCGTNSHQEINELRRNNIEVIITDHHEQSQEGNSGASAIINPKLKGSSYKYRELAGVGVAYKLSQAIAKEVLAEELDLVSLGTIADIVPLTGENRIIAKEGLQRLSLTKRLGLKALMENSGIVGKKMSSTSVSYILAPRLNASGRMDSAEIALNLLMSEEKEEAATLASLVEGYNRQRQKVESKILEEAQAIIDKEVNFKEHKIIVIAKEDWHQGVLGVVASKLADRFYRPTILISLSDELCKGSGRSIKNFHLFQALLECKDSLSSFGGHSHAVGIMIAKDNIEDFKDKINQLAKQRLKLEDLIPSLDIDMELTLADLGEGLAREIESLEPFGKGNPEPLFYTRNLKLRGEPQVLSRYTLKFWVSGGNNTYEAIGFGLSNLKESLVNSDYFDLVYTPQIDSWQGEEGVILEVKDIFFR
ncbi:MAG: single-stranded-DNA-specific exonuclease RecJ, partial [Candidatus Omnitrophica bacterium]|nr:single-stranded-DNA-specific exonuclease RecJ [Candidatus Omnitrophota bacterium]